jgi:hypothetical protein
MHAHGTLAHNTGVESGEALPSDVLVEYVCLAKHRSDPILAPYTLTKNLNLPAYCARGADRAHEWIRVPATPANLITIGNMEDRPPQPRGRATL